jgi:hypothetical protein
MTVPELTPETEDQIHGIIESHKGMSELQRALVARGLVPTGGTFLGGGTWEFPCKPERHLAWSEAACLVAFLVFVLALIWLLHG